MRLSRIRVLGKFPRKLNVQFDDYKNCITTTREVLPPFINLYNMKHTATMQPVYELASWDLPSRHFWVNQSWFNSLKNRNLIVEPTALGILNKGVPSVEEVKDFYSSSRG